MKRQWRWSLFFCIVILIFTGFIWKTTPSFNFIRSSNDVINVTWRSEPIVPNIVHYVLFGKTTLDFVSFLSILSAIKVQHPERVLIHSDTGDFTGYYWSILQSLPVSNLSIEVRFRLRPTHVYGQPLSSVFHATDITRIQVLMEWGGIYLDSDVLVLRSLDRFRHYEMVVGWPQEQFIGTQILLSHKNARLLPLWLEGYRRYRSRDWYYNAGQFPTELVLKQPELVHREPLALGVHNVAANLYGASPWPKWHQLFAVHLLSRHPPAPLHMDEEFVRHYRAPFGEIARWILYELQPKVVYPLPN